jgi:aquaporin Z
MLLSGRMKGSECAGYIVAQLIGATIGAGFLYCLTQMGLGYEYGGTTPASGSFLATNVLQDGATPMMALLTEALLSFFFILVILGATDEKVSNTKFAGIAIGLALGLVNIVGIPVDNCSVNPARSFGPAVFDPTAWGDFWIMVVGPAIGAILAAVVWKSLSTRH